LQRTEVTEVWEKIVDSNPDSLLLGLMA
jgi:hypothetical protein